MNSVRCTSSPHLNVLSATRVDTSYYEHLVMQMGGPTLWAQREAGMGRRQSKLMPPAFQMASRQWQTMCMPWVCH